MARPGRTVHLASHLRFYLTSLVSKFVRTRSWHFSAIHSGNETTPERKAEQIYRQVLGAHGVTAPAKQHRPEATRTENRSWGNQCAISYNSLVFCWKLAPEGLTKVWIEHIRTRNSNVNAKIPNNNSKRLCSTEGNIIWVAWWLDNVSVKSTSLEGEIGRK